MRVDNINALRPATVALAAGLLGAVVAVGPSAAAQSQAAQGTTGSARVTARLAADDTSSAGQFFATVSPSPFIHVGGSAQIVARVPSGQGASDVQVTLNGTTSGFTVSQATAAQRQNGVVAVVTAGAQAAHATLTVSIPGTSDSETLPLESFTSAAQLAAGKGAWISFDTYGAMSPSLMLERMHEEGITHVYIETGGDHFIEQSELNALLEPAHNLGIAVIAFAWAPLNEVQTEIASAGQTIAYAAPDGGQVDGFSGDFEQNLSAGAMQEFSAAVRQDLGPNRVYVACIYAPQFGFATPIATMAHYVDVFAPMDYWMAGSGLYTTARVKSFVTTSINELRDTPGEDNVPIEVISQTQDIVDQSGFGALNPPAAQVTASAQAAVADGAIGVSFYELRTQTPAQIAAITAFQMP